MESAAAAPAPATIAAPPCLRRFAPRCFRVLPCLWIPCPVQATHLAEGMERLARVQLLLHLVHATGRWEAARGSAHHGAWRAPHGVPRRLARRCQLHYGALADDVSALRRRPAGRPPPVPCRSQSSSECAAGERR